MRATAVVLAAIVAVSAGSARGQQLPTAQDNRLVPAYTFGRITNAIATTPSGRVFAGFPQVDGASVQVMELGGNGDAHAFPDAMWNRGLAAAAGDVAHSFVLVNALRVGPDGALWVVDAGAPGVGKPAVPGGARLFRIDLDTNRVAAIYALDGAVTPMSYIDDVRFNGTHAYLTDAGSPALLVLDLPTGNVRWVLDHDPTTTDLRPMRADGRVLRDEQGRGKRVHADQLEVSPDGRWLYYQPASGPLARIETRWLDDPGVLPAELARHAETWLDLPTSGGTAIDADGDILYGDADNRRVLRITPAGEVSTLVADPRLVWVDAMWIDDKGTLWIPANQMNRTPGFNGGVNAVQYPVTVFTMFIDARPPPNDHP